MTQDDLALLANTDRPTVLRCLKRLEEEGFMHLGYQTLTVLGDYALNERDLNFRISPAGGNRSLLAEGEVS